MHNLLSIEQLDRDQIERLMDRAASFAEVSDREIKKVPTLRGRLVVNLFYEASTRTRSSFELAAKRLSADVLNFAASGSSVDKGESLKDTIATLASYEPDALVIRSPHVGAAALVSTWTGVSVVNAGDGTHEHPTQALLDVFTLTGRIGRLDGKRIWIVGDVLHSRVARSNILAFSKLGARVTVCGPPTLIPPGIETLGCEVRYDLGDLGEADVIYALRMQNERMREDYVPTPARIRLLLPDQRGSPRRPSGADAPWARQPWSRALERCRGFTAGADHRPGSGRRGGPHGGSLRAPRRRPRPGRRGDRERFGEHGGPTRMRRLFSAPTPPASILIRGARLLDPRSDLDGPGDVLIRAGVIAEIGEPGSLPAPPDAEVVDGTGRELLAAFVDPHVHFRVPGQEHKEDLHTATRAAAAGGYCAVVGMPNTDPVVDSTAVLGSLRDVALRDARVPAGFMAAISPGLGGQSLTEMVELREGGALGFTDDGRPVVSAGLLRRALQYQRLCGGVLALHEEDPTLSGAGRDARGRCLGAARHRRDPVGLGVDDGRPGRGPRRPRGRPCPHAAPLGTSSRSTPSRPPSRPGSRSRRRPRRTT